MSRKRHSRAAALYRLALRLLPVGIRTRHGAAMERLLLENLGQARGPVGRTGVLIRALTDVVVRGLYERLRRNRRPQGEAAVSGLVQDLRFALRSLRREPRFAIMAIVTLALGIGANSALFSVVHGVLLRPLPFFEADRVVHLAWQRGGGQSGLSPHGSTHSGVTTERPSRP